MIQDIAPHVFHNEFAAPIPTPNAQVFAFDGKNVLLAGGKALPTVAQVTALGTKAEELVYLFAVDEQRFFLLATPSAAVCAAFEAAPSLAFRELEPFYLRLAGATALHLNAWYRANRFCGRCGTQNHPDDKERAMRCSACGTVVYPRINPAIVVAVRHGDRLLLTRYANRPGVTRYALVAGFVEIGETMEQTVRREVTEEVGLRVKNVRYHGNQPWGFAGNLMVGFWADLDGGEAVTLDTQELSEAVWLRRDEIPENHDPIDLTHTMIEMFRLGADPR